MPRPHSSREKKQRQGKWPSRVSQIVVGNRGRGGGEKGRGRVVDRFIICNHSVLVSPPHTPPPLPLSLSVRTSDPGDTEQRTELVQSSQQLSKLSATSLHSGDPPTAPPPPPPPSPPTSIFLQAASYLLDVHALKVSGR